MNLPMSYPRPVKDKYVDEETRLFAIWFIFGEHTNGIDVDIADTFGDVITGIPRQQAERLVEARGVFVNTLLRETEV
jgi:hypothetical protein